MTRLKIIAGCLLVGILWGGVMLEKSVKKFYTLQHEVIVRQQQNAAQKKIIKSKLMYLSKGKNEFLDALLSEAQARGLLVASIVVVKNQENAMQLKLVLQGNFLQFLILIESLAQKKMCLQIDALDVASERSIETIKLTMTILSIQMDGITARQHVAADDPFEPNHFTNLLFDYADDKQKISIDEMKYVGYLQMGHQQMAVLQLPNGVAQDVTLNEVVGVEHALVTRIAESAMTLRVNGQEKIKPLV